jgi:hypothetical protein
MFQGTGKNKRVIEVPIKTSALQARWVQVVGMSTLKGLQDSVSGWVCGGTHCLRRFEFSRSSCNAISLCPMGESGEENHLHPVLTILLEPVLA